MKTMHLFAALRPEPGFPNPTADIKIGNVRYDLVLPEEISNLLLLQFIDNTASYHCAERYCNQYGFEQIHKQPALLNAELQGRPAYAITLEAAEDVPEEDDLIGAFSMRLAVGPLAARRLFERALARESIDLELADYVTKREAFFNHCDGFELLRLRCYFDAEERNSVMQDVENEEPPSSVLKELGAGKINFKTFYENQIKLNQEK